MLTFDLIDNMLGLGNTAHAYFRNSHYNGRLTDNVPVNIYQGDDFLEIRSLMPGINNDDVSVELVDNTIVISGEKKFDGTDNSYIRRERNFGKFKRIVNLPYQVNTQNIHASVENGILTIKLHKSDDAKTRKIEIH